MATHPMRIQSGDELLRLVAPSGIAGYELVNGELVELSPVGPAHGELALRIGALLLDHIQLNGVDGRAFIETGFVLGLRRDPERLRGPDVSFVKGEPLRRHGQRDAERCFRFAPELAIEIASLQQPKEPRQRIEDYLEAGTRLVWVIHIETRSVNVYHPGRRPRLLLYADTIDGEDVIPGFHIALIDLFAA